MGKRKFKRAENQYRDRDRRRRCSISSLLALLNFLIGTNTLLDKIPSYFELDFLQTKGGLTIREEIAILEISGKLKVRDVSLETE